MKVYGLGLRDRYLGGGGGGGGGPPALQFPMSLQVGPTWKARQVGSCILAPCWPHESYLIWGYYGTQYRVRL